MTKPSSQSTNRIPTIVHSISASPFLQVRARHGPCLITGSYPGAWGAKRRRRSRAGLSGAGGGTDVMTVCAVGCEGKSGMERRAEERLRAWREPGGAAAPAGSEEDLRAVAEYVAGLEAEIRRL